MALLNFHLSNTIGFYATNEYILIKELVMWAIVIKIKTQKYILWMALN